ncbi:MAG: ATP-binding protein [Anaerolineae bacterium]
MEPLVFHQQSPPQPTVDLSLHHLQAELIRIDVLLHREITRWQEAGQDETDPFRGQYITDEDAGELLRRPFGYSWGQVAPEPERQQQAYRRALAQAEKRVEKVVEAARQQGHRLRLRHLAEVFGLNRFEVDTLLICLAPTLDLSYEQIYGYLQDDVTRKRPNVNLILNMCAPPGVNRLPLMAYLQDSGNLFKYYLLERVTEPGPVKPPLLGQTLHVDETIVSWLLGSYQPHPELGEYASLSTPTLTEADRLLAGEALPALAQLALETGAAPLMTFYGPDRAAQKAAARLLAGSLQRPLLRVNLGAIVKNDISPLRAVRLALRDASLTRAIPFLISHKTDREDAGLSPAVLAELCAYPDIAIIAGEHPWHASGIPRQRQLMWLEFPVPLYSQRRNLWLHFLGSSANADTLNIKDLAGQFVLTTGQIRDVVSTARDMAWQAGEPIGDDYLFTAARSHSSSRLAMLARKIEPRYDWEDIILPGDQRSILREMVDTVRGRPLVLEEWGVGHKLTASAGVTSLFAGTPGTGKTMAAEVIAKELGLDLYKIDLSSVISKYIGETEKNLEKIFREAESSNAILFFDEADSIFGKRSEVKDSHDRYANIEISYLLQRMEAYDGVTILATNLRANLDEAFTRRLQFVVDFPFPEKEDRLRIWQTLFPPKVPTDNSLDFVYMANRFKLAGGNIRNVIANAAFLAAADGGQVTMEHLLHSTRREMQKMGRLVPEADLQLPQ